MGQLLLALGARNALLAAEQLQAEFLLRHQHVDSGGLDPNDRRAHAQALRRGGQLISSHHTRLDAKLSIITEGDRSARTFLLPEEC